MSSHRTAAGGIEWRSQNFLAAGTAAFCRTPLFVPLAAAAVLGLALSVVQVLTDSAALALFFPWRVSAVLVPVATGAAAAGLARLAERAVPPRLLLALSGLLAVAAVFGAGVVYWRQLGYQQTAAEAELLAARVARNGSTQDRLHTWWTRMRQKISGRDA